ncbi:MAG: hypothetical protein HKL82_08755 [Acidimicrobiaceae bacterium]|nr:hypothetical protein [Acidimicrobiaceae bacterium]
MDKTRFKMSKTEACKMAAELVRIEWCVDGRYGISIPYDWDHLNIVDEYSYPGGRLDANRARAVEVVLGTLHLMGVNWDDADWAVRNFRDGPFIGFRRMLALVLEDLNG